VPGTLVGLSTGEVVVERATIAPASVHVHFRASVTNQRREQGHMKQFQGRTAVNTGAASVSASRSRASPDQGWPS